MLARGGIQGNDGKTRSSLHLKPLPTWYFELRSILDEIIHSQKELKVGWISSCVGYPKQK